MAFSADVFRLFIASPGDVDAERKAIRDIVNEWNIRHAYASKRIILPIGWETHSTPDMSAPAQSILNKQLLEDCDLLVGVFWKKIGTPTEGYASGTVEEIERHIAANKPTMLYFSSKPAAPETIDSKQYNKLMKFKESCKSRGLYKTFKSLGDFKKQFENNLTIKMNEEYFNSNFELNFDNVNNYYEPNLTEDEKFLLKEASKDKHGTIYKYSVHEGTFIQTNGKHIFPKFSAREIARWTRCLELLIEKGYVKEESYKGEAFKVTSLGFEVADTL